MLKDVQNCWQYFRVWSILQIILTNTYFCVRFWTVLPDMQTKVNKIEWPNFQIKIINCICSNNRLVQAIWFFWGNRRRLFTQTLIWKISVSWQLWSLKYWIELNWRGFIMIVKVDRIVYLRPHRWPVDTQNRMDISRAENTKLMGSPHCTQPYFPDRQRSKTYSGWPFPASILLPSLSEKAMLVIFVAVWNNSTGDLFSFEPPPTV